MVTFVTSRPVWGAWIEITISGYGRDGWICRAPYGARGLKFNYDIRTLADRLVAPRMGRVD